MVENRLKFLRMKKGITLSELSAVIGLRDTTLSQYENCVRQPSIETALKLADFYNVSLDFIFIRF